MDGVDFYRGILLIGYAIIGFFILAQYGFALFRGALSVGQKLWATGTLCLVIYATDATFEAIETHLEYRWRLIPLTVGLIALGAYVMEPRSSRWKRYGQKKVLGTDWRTSRRQSGS